MSASSGSILLGAVAARTAEIEIACRMCPRHGKLHTDRLMQQYGPEMPMPELLRLLAADCPRLRGTDPNKRYYVASATTHSFKCRPLAFIVAAVGISIGGRHWARSSVRCATSDLNWLGW